MNSKLVFDLEKDLDSLLLQGEDEATDFQGAPTRDRTDLKLGGKVRNPPNSAVGPSPDYMINPPGRRTI